MLKLKKESKQIEKFKVMWEDEIKSKEDTLAALKSRLANLEVKEQSNR